MKRFLYILLMFCGVAGFSQYPNSSGYLLTNENGTVSIGTRVSTAPLTVANFSTSFPSPQAGTIVHLVSDAITNGRISFDTYQNTNFTGSNYQGRRARGTAALPTAALADDILVAIGADGYGDDSFTGLSIGSMNIRANGTFTNLSKPTYISFTTTPSGSTTQVERVRIKADGTFQITGLNAVGFLQTDANGNFSTAALSSGNITTALGYTPLAANGDGSLLTGLTKTQVGLANVDNTSDANKPVSSATQTALNLKANLASPTFTGTVSGITASMVGLGNVTNESKATMFTNPAFTGTATGLTKAMVGLGNVDNTSDAAKPVSTATQTALNLKQDALVSGTNIKTVNGNTLLGSGDVVVGGGATSSTSGVAATATASGTQTITHNLGRTPTIIRIYSISSFTSSTSATPVPFSNGVWNSSGNRCVYMVINGTTTQVSQTSTVFSVIMVTSAGNQITGVIGNVTGTGFDITWSETGTHTAGNFLWEAQ